MRRRYLLLHSQRMGDGRVRQRRLGRRCFEASEPLASDYFQKLQTQADELRAEGRLLESASVLQKWVVASGSPEARLAIGCGRLRFLKNQRIVRITDNPIGCSGPYPPPTRVRVRE